MSRLLNRFFWGLLLLFTGCIDPFEPEVINSPTSYLVVDGFINLKGVTTIRLSRTQNISATTAPTVEAKASISIQDDAGITYPLAEQAPGTYVSPTLTLDPNRKYQLQLRTTAGRRYASDLVPAKISPEIDSLTWELESQGVGIKVNSHDPANNTRYYRWSYEETWEFRSTAKSYYEYVNGAIRPRIEDIHTCWSSISSSSIQLSNTARLSQDVVSDFPLISLPVNSVKLRLVYSVLVSQYAQTAEEYAYWEKLKKNTESLGGLFDPLPTQITGNVRSLDDATEMVIGFIGATSVTQKRLFIEGIQLPTTRFVTGYESCPNPIPSDTIFLNQLHLFGNIPIVPVQPVYLNDTTIIGYYSGSVDCIDCRRRGTNVRPSFWP